MELYESGKIIEKVDLKNIFDKIIKRYDEKSLYKEEWKQEDLTFVVKERYKIIFQKISFPRNYSDFKKKEDFTYYNMNGVVLVK